MRLAIDASRITVARRTGTENYALQLLRALLPLLSEHDVRLYFRDVPAPNLLPNLPHVEQQVIPWPRLWTHIRLAAALWARRPDLTFVPAHTLPRFFPGRAAVTVHDLGYIHFPEAHPEKERRYLDWSTRYSAGRARRILADSRATQADLMQHYNIHVDKIRIVYPGVDESLKPMRDAAELAAVRAKYGLPERYLLFIGTLQPRKNIARLTQAFAQWRANAPQDQDIVLALGGGQGWLYDPSWVADVPNVALLGYVADEDLAALYSGALGFVFPSLYEGFGFPLLEAMRCETPVLCSDTSSLPELGGEAALYVNSLEVESIQNGIVRLVALDEGQRQRMIALGREQANRFTWEASAQAALKVLEEAAE